MITESEIQRARDISHQEGLVATGNTPTCPDHGGPLRRRWIPRKKRFTKKLHCTVDGECRHTVPLPTDQYLRAIGATPLPGIA